MNALHVFILLTVGSFHLTTRKMYNGLNIIRQRQYIINTANIK